MKSHLYYNEITEIYTIYDNSRNKIGYAFYTEGRGFTNKMVILIGLEDEEVIKGIDVVSHYEDLSSNNAAYAISEYSGEGENNKLKAVLSNNGI